MSCHVSSYVDYLTSYASNQLGYIHVHICMYMPVYIKLYVYGEYPLRVNALPRRPTALYPEAKQPHRAPNPKLPKP